MDVFRTSSDDSARLARAVHETLDALVAPAIRDALIHDALVVAGLPALPSDRAAMVEFAGTALLRVVARALGAELGRSVVDEIVRTVRPSEYPGRAERGGPAALLPTERPPRRRSPHPPVSLREPGGARRPSSIPPPMHPDGGPLSSRARYSTPPTSPHASSPPPPVEPRRSATPPVTDLPVSAWPAGLGSHIRTGGAPRDTQPMPAVTDADGFAPPPAPARVLVLVAADDPSLCETLADWFGARAELVTLRGPTDLVRHLGARADRRCIIVMDGRSTPIRPAALAVLLEEHDGVDVVVCRAAAATEEVLVSGSAATRGWVVYREPASLDHVAAECVRLVS